jgi:hypothetical protein
MDYAKNPSRFHRRVVYALDFYLPLPLTALMFWLWWARTGSAAFAAYTIAAGLVFGYLVPGIGTNLLGLWRFSGPWKLGAYYPHHGFLYAPYLSLVLYGCFGVWDTLTVGQAVTSILCMGFAQGLVSSLHDISGIKAGMIRIFNSKSASGSSPEEIVMECGPLGFGLFGAVYALFGVLAYRFYVLEGAGGWLSVAAWALGCAAAMGLAGVPYVIKERRFIGAARARIGNAGRRP